MVGQEVGRMAASKDTIAEVFRKHVERFGYQKTTLDEVAAELHISKKTIYTHFDGKADIWGYVVAQIAAREKIRMRQALADASTYAEKVGRLVTMTLSMARVHIAETSEADWMQEYEIAGEAFRLANGEMLRELVTEGMVSGEFVAGDPVLVERTVGAAILEYVIMVREKPDYDRDEELVERVLRFIG
jgi:AcrR family transcriptional regulator